MTTRAFSGTVRVVVPSCNARQSAPGHSSSRVPVWMSRPLVACGGGVLLAIGAVVAVHTIIEPLYHVSSAASPYSPMWRIMDPLEALAVVLGVIGGSRRTRRVAHNGAAPITREWLAANALCYGFLCVGILCFWSPCSTVEYFFGPLVQALAGQFRRARRVLTPGAIQEVFQQNLPGVGLVSDAWVAWSSPSLSPSGSPHSEPRWHGPRRSGHRTPGRGAALPRV